MTIFIYGVAAWGAISLGCTVGLIVGLMLTKWRIICEERDQSS